MPVMYLRQIFADQTQDIVRVVPGNFQRRL